ncbi:aspartyl protease family protein [Psychroserpens jangbogonensis]|uniref:aspartyl protease family protein n=1 Tax=Psychroserpens jangbogonensis TaxID=1484460 RepID=UPI00053D34F9|nr:aspartyl protease family protein [Psychroserpens jangbogonensis]
MLKKNSLLLFLLFAITSSFSQSDFSLPNLEKDKIRFELIGNLIILPVEVNGVELSFVLDTGVSKPILFNLANIDSLQINKVESILLRGLGGGAPVEAIKSKHNFLSIGNAININQDIYLVFDSSINFTARLGRPVHGIIGYDLFKDFIVEINYASKYIVLHKPNSYTYKSCKKCETFDLSFYKNKPYVFGEIEVDSSFVPVKLLIDTGSSDALWIFENEDKGLVPTENMYFDDFLGKGLSGNIYGKRSKIERFRLKKFELNNVNTAFPDSTSISFARKYTQRNGSISGEVLKRFNMIVDYKNKKLTLKKNKNFRSSFSYNKSGIIIEQNGVIMIKERKNRSGLGFREGSDANIHVETITHYKLSVKPAYTIVEIRKDSPAEKAGLLVGDIILTINGKETHILELQNVVGYFKSKTGKLINLKINRNGRVMLFGFRLEDVFKQKELP